MNNFMKNDQCQKNENDWLSRYKKDINSLEGEDGIIEKIFEIIKTENKWCVEFGAWDGKFASNVRNLIVNEKWSGVLIEADKNRYKDLVETYKNNQDIICVNKYVDFEGSNTLDQILSKTSIPKFFDLLSVDIDGNDYHVWKSFKQYEPRVVVIEFNPSMSVDIEYIQPRDMKVNHGSSLMSLVKLGKEKNYELVATTTCNAIFVNKSLFDFFKIENNSPSSLYKSRPYETRLLQMYDGSIKIFGCKRLIWHDLKINEKTIQVLPKIFTGFPPRFRKIGLFMLLSGQWKKFLFTLSQIIKNRIR